MRLTEAPTIGFTKCRKNATTSPVRLRAMTSMTTRSFPKTDRCSAGRAGVSLIGAADEPVAAPAHGLDEGGMPRVVAELLAQPGDEDVDRAVEGLPVQAARGFQDPVAPEHAPAMAHEQGEQLEL